MIEEEKATVYRATTAGRRFLTKRAAINAEARAILDKEWPREPAEYDAKGFRIYPGDGGWRKGRVEEGVPVFHRVVAQLKAGIPIDEIEIEFD